MSEKEAEELAKRIIDALMRNGANEVATRLELKQWVNSKNEMSLGGWCRSAAEDEVLMVLQGWMNSRSV